MWTSLKSKISWFLIIIRGRLILTHQGTLLGDSVSWSGHRPLERTIYVYVYLNVTDRHRQIDKKLNRLIDRLITNEKKITLRKRDLCAYLVECCRQTNR